ncbi:MAG: hypothetical protein J0H01_29045 [Rhizobiales bacterium]|nr:hypothetical protein [Hyphomicrobiales bacterium]
MDNKKIFYAVLRFDAQDWSGPAPLLDAPPITTHLDKNGAPSEFVYDLFPTETELPIPEACDLIVDILSEVEKDGAPLLRDAAFCRRCKLDIAIAVYGDLAMFSYTWPTEFIAFMARAGIGLSASHYLQSVFAEVQAESNGTARS